MYLCDFLMNGPGNVDFKLENTYFPKELSLVFDIKLLFMAIHHKSTTVQSEIIFHCILLNIHQIYEHV